MIIQINTKKVYIFSIGIIQFLILSFIGFFITPATASACNVYLGSTNAWYHDIGGGNHNINSENLILDNQISGSLQASTSSQKSSDCGSITPLLDIIIAREKCTSTSTCTFVDIQQTGWLSNPSLNYPIPNNISFFRIWFHIICNTTSTCTSQGPETKDFFTVHQDSNQVAPDGRLSAKFTMPWYDKVSNPNWNNPTYSVLVGTDPLVIRNRDSNSIPSGATEILIPTNFVTFSNLNSPTVAIPDWKISMNINFQIPDLQPSTTYYWRLKQTGSSTTGYFPGGIFTKVIDTTLPTSTFTNPPAGTTMRRGVHDVTITDADNIGLASCEYRVTSNGVEAIPWTTRICNAPVELTVFNNGLMCRDNGANTCTVYARSTDSSNNVSVVVSRTFSIDLTAPLVTINRTPYTAASTDNITFTANATSDVGSISTIKIYIDPTATCGIFCPLIPIKTCTGTSTCSYTGTYTTGNHTFDAWAYDDTSNLGKSLQDNFSVGQTISGATVTPGTDIITLSNLNIAAGQTGIIPISQGSTSINKLGITASTAITNAEVIITKTQIKPDSVSAIIGKNVHTYLNFSETNLPVTSVSSGIIEFQVPRSSGLDPTTIRLQRFNSGSWVELPTTKYSEDANNYYFSATSPGFSVFAVTTPQVVEPPGSSGGGTPTATASNCILETDLTKVRATGLVTSKLISDFNKFAVNVNGQSPCVVDPAAALVTHKIPSYASLKSIYFDQSKSTNKVTVTPSGDTQTGLSKTLITPAAGQTIDNKAIVVAGNLTIDSTTDGNVFTDTTGTTTPIPVVVFVNNNLNIQDDIVYAKDNKDAGLVFVVSGDVNIDNNVTEINAVIISEGQICTAYDFTIPSCPTTNVTTPQLVIYGSLISLWVADPDQPGIENKIKFKRTLANNTQAAEKIQAQPKYLVIMRNIFASPIQKWTELK